MGRKKRPVIKQFRINNHVVIMCSAAVFAKEVGMSTVTFHSCVSRKMIPMDGRFKYDSLTGNRYWYVYPIDYIGAGKYVFKEVIRYTRSKYKKWPVFARPILKRVASTVEKCIYDYGKVRNEYDLKHIADEFPEFDAARAVDYIIELRQTYEKAFEERNENS